MEFEREFIRVDSALRATALSDTIRHAGACSHMQIASLESLLPGTITESCIGRGFTTEASVENFQKVKEVVGNAIRTVIAKIKEMIKRFLDWFKGKDNVSPPEAKKIAVRVEAVITDVQKLKRDSTQQSHPSLSEMQAATKSELVRISAAQKAWLEAKQPTNQENEAIVKEWLAQTIAKDGNFIDAIVGSFDDDTFDRALFGIMMEGITGSDYQLITGAHDIADEKHYIQVLDAIVIVGGVDISIPSSSTMTNKLFAISHAIMSMHIATCKKNSNTAEISSVLSPTVYFDTPDKYNTSVRACIAALFKSDAVLATNDTVFKDTEQVNKLLGVMARVKIVLSQRIPAVEEIIDDIQQELANPAADVPKDEIKATNALLSEMRYALDYAIRLNTLSNRILVGMNKFCDRVKRGT